MEPRDNRAMFDRIAHRYDLLNRVMSLGLDGRWRRRLVDHCAVSSGMRCLDLCTGTGDVAREIARRGAAVVGLDASAGMLAVARARVGERVALVQGDALQLPFPEASFDAVTIAFGNRNVASLPRLYAEMRRVLRPGGRAASLEINSPRAAWMRWPFFLYFAHLPALLARVAGADPAAYQYLPASVRAYPDAETVAGIMRNAGLERVTYEAHVGGAIVLHCGMCPAPTSGA